MDEQPAPAINASAAPSNRTRPIAEVPELAQLAAELLRTTSALTALSAAEAQCVVAYMRLVSCPAGATVMREGDQAHTGYMLLLLNGEISVEALQAGQADAVSISVLGPGNLFGEMSLLDGEPRSVSCVAATRIDAAGLSREALEALLRDNPGVGARFMTAVAKRLADRLRAAGDQLRIYSQITTDMQKELDCLRRRS